MKTTLELPDELVREVKIRAVFQGRTFKDLVTEFVRQGLRLPPVETKPPSRSTKVAVDVDGLPVIQSRPRTGRRKMTVDQALKLEREAEYQEELKRAGLAR